MKANFPTYKEIAKKAAEEALDGCTYHGKTLREWVNVVEQWRELKETIIELRDNDGTGTQQEICKFLANYMDVLEKNVGGSEVPNKWVPVSERMPEKIGTYMTTVDYGCLGIEVGQRHYHGKFLGWEDACVTAWMPLPEPYKESEEE